ncbi:hypothetical protein DC915_RS02440 [Vibrio parahaemolyticus]|jgi:hypothetical protein|nr:hypothetical protein [Vibrio parahaemolyticus]EJE4724541.1 hypothetical protein [Vibrio parahaemolyticus]EJG0009835.1 hypothetical protein [Vibrio parahaemolyticus]EJO2025815.1 hypothetical protein [Vibrio parahaemolyticus]ELA8176663.1 hypothetical protein [Vibrio alginolyticus]
MATYYTDDGEVYSYTIGEPCWRDCKGNPINELQPDNLPVPPLYNEDGSSRYAGYFKCMIRHVETELQCELNLHSVDQVISKCYSLYPGVDITLEQRDQMMTTLNISQEDADWLAEFIPYAINDGFELHGNSIEIDAYEEDVKPRHFDWKLL